MYIHKTLKTGNSSIFSYFIKTNSTLFLGLFAFGFDDKQLLDIGNNFGCFIVGTDYLSPADSILYKARDVTATVDSFGLIIGNFYNGHVYLNSTRTFYLHFLYV